MKNVLIISPNIVLSKRLDIILTLEGYFCITILSGGEVLNIIHQKNFDIVFFDEKINGITFEEIRKSSISLNLSFNLFVLKPLPKNIEIQKTENERIYYIDKSIISKKLPVELKKIIEN